jgi:PAS domain S-box-containing protein
MTMNSRNIDLVFCSIADEAPDPIIVLSEGRFAYLNSAACLLLEVESQEKLLGTPVLEYTHPDYLDVVRDKIINHKVAEHLEFQLSTNNSRQIWVETSGKYIEWEGEKRLVHFLRDISGRKEIERTLRENYKKVYLNSFLHDLADRKTIKTQIKLLSRAVEQSPVSIMITDINGNIEYVNPAFEAITGYLSEEIIGQNPRVLKSGKQSPEFYKYLWDTILSGKDWRGEFKNKKKNGEFFWEHTVISPILNEQNEVTNFVSIREDVTDRKKMIEDLIAAKEHAEENDRLKLAFLANMSHEMRTPMNGILGFAEILKEPGLTEQERLEYIDIIQKSGKRMLDTVNDLIDISKLETGQVKLYISETNLNEQIENLLSFFKPQAREKNLQLIYKDPVPSDAAIITTDPAKIDSIMTNLLKNAIKFTDQGRIEFGCIKKDNFLEFYISDTGIGVPPERQNDIFKRFEQVDIQNVRANQGSGLGLAITRSYVEMLGGKIWLQSVEGSGSTFYFTIPYKKDEIEMDKHSGGKINRYEGIPQLNGKTILLSEDDFYSREMLTYLLEKTNSRVLVAIDGLETIEKFQQHNCDLVLLDIRLPHKNGFDVLKELRAAKPGILVIAQTAYAMLEDIRKLNEAGFDGYLTKPIKQDELFNVLSRFLG